jgi:hypothetical protein
LRFPGFQFGGPQLERVGRRAGSRQPRGGVIERLRSFVELFGPASQFLLLLTLPQTERTLLIVVEGRPRVEYRLAASQFTLTGGEMLRDLGGLLLHLVNG